MGDSLYQIAILWLVFEITGSATATGIIGLSQYLPAILFGPLAGALVDRWNRKAVMIWSDLVRAGLVALIPILYFSGNMTGILLGLFAFTVNLFTAAFLPARDSIVPMVVEEKELTRAGSLLQASYGFAYFTGPMVAAAILPYAGTPVLFFANALTYIGSLLFLLKLKPRATTIAHEVVSPRKLLKEGLSFAKEKPLIWGLLMITAVDNLFIMGPALVGTPLYVRLHLKAGPEAFAAIEAAFALGMITGSIIIHRYGARLPRGKVLLSALIFDGITFVPLMITDSLIPVLIVWYIHSIGIPFILVPRTTLVQSRVPPRLHGRIFSLIHLTVIGLSALSCGLTGIISESLPVNELYAVIGLSATVIGAAGWFNRELREAV